MRDAWFISLAAAACIADFPAPELKSNSGKAWVEAAAVSGVLGALLLIAAPLIRFTARDLDRAISADFPVNAVNFLRRNPNPAHFTII